MTAKRERTWLREGRLFIREGWIEVNGGARVLVYGGELHLVEGYLYLNGSESERRSGVERRQVERREGAGAA